MLQSLTVGNYKCFGAPAELSLVATREQRYADHLAHVERGRIVPVAAIFGANASGKSTVIRALQTLRDLVVAPRQPTDLLPIKPNLVSGAEDPTFLRARILVTVDGREASFVYEVRANERRIISERLLRASSKGHTCIYERDIDRGVQLYGLLARDKTAQAYATVVDSNQTLLGALGQRTTGTVRSVWEWFSRDLKIIYPGWDYVALPARFAYEEVFADALNHSLSRADTGISRLETRPVPLSALLLPTSEEETQVRLKREGGSVVASTRRGAPAIVHLDAKGDLEAEELVSIHNEDGQDFHLSLTDESDGTRRFMHLLPVVFQLGEADTHGVFVIDELENSLHPHLTESIIASFLAGLDKHSRRQLIVSTHETTLMRADLLRRDEMWIAEKRDGSSQLTRVSDFAPAGVRKGADLFNMYMSGRLGGVPTL